MKFNTLPVLLAGTFLTTSAVAQTVPTINTDYLNSLTGEKITWEDATASDEDTVQIGDKFYKYTYHKPNDYTETSERINNTLGDYNVADIVFSGISSDSSGAAIYNVKNKSDININADFLSLSSNNWGGAVYNGGNIGNITGNFVGNYVFEATPSANGGAISNSGKINNIVGNFVGNYTISSSDSVHGGAIYNSGEINDIIGNFVGNYINSSDLTSIYGGAIFNINSVITNIQGDFIGNSAIGKKYVLGGAIHNSSSVVISNITGNFIGNNVVSSTQYYYVRGGAICNDDTSTIKSITGDFIENYAKSNESAEGGAIFQSNYATIDTILGNFTGNYVSGSDWVSGGAIKTFGYIGVVTGDFIGNYATSASSYAIGGAIYYAHLSNGSIINSNFIDNYVEGNANSKGGAIYATTDLTIIADNGTSTFSGNKVNGESNAIYVSDANLNLDAKNKGTITFDDAIDGTSYSINITGDVCENCFVNSVAFNNDVTNVTDLTLDTTQMALGKNAYIEVTNNYIARNNPLLRVEVDLADNKAGQLFVDGNIYGRTSVIVDTKNYKDVRGEESIVFAQSNGDIYLDGENGTKAETEEEKAQAFSVARVIGSPYMWNVEYEDGGVEKIWSLAMNDTENTYTEDCEETAEKPEVDDNSSNTYRDATPEIIAGIGLHTAGIEQTRTVVRNVASKVASSHSYCPNCGIVSDAWDGKQLHNAWVLAQGEYSNIDKQVDMDAKIWGVEGGFDLQSDINNTFGIFASYRNGEYDLNGNGVKYHSEIGSEIEIDSYLAGLYYRYDKNMNWVFATVYGGTQDAEAKTDDGIASFETDGLEFGASVEVGHSFALSRNTTLSPSLGIFYTQINYDNANDNVGKEYKWDDIKHLEAELGLSLAKNFENGKVYVKPSVIQTLTDDDEVSITGLNEADTYHDQTLGRIEIGGSYGFNDNWSAYGWANYTFGSSYDATSLGVGANYSW